MAATRKFPNAEIVKVYSHLGITPETKAELKKLVIKSFDRIGNTYSALWSKRDPRVRAYAGSLASPVLRAERR